VSKRDEVRETLTNMLREYRHANFSLDFLVEALVNALEARNLLPAEDDKRQERFDEALQWTLTEHGETLRRLGES